MCHAINYPSSEEGMNICNRNFTEKICPLLCLYASRKFFTAFAYLVRLVLFHLFKILSCKTTHCRDKVNATSFHFIQFFSCLHILFPIQCFGEVK